MRYVRFNLHDLRNDPRIGRWYGHVNSQPSWVWKLAGGAALLVLIVPILTLVLTAGLAFAATFAALIGVRRLGRWLGDRLNLHRRNPPSAGRRNVRVVRTGD